MGRSWTQWIALSEVGVWGLIDIFYSHNADIPEVPVMLMSNRCNLRGMTRDELMSKGEEPVEHGGYFISGGGGEKVGGAGEEWLTSWS